MKTIVFGGSGFLGSHVADELSNRGHQVIIFDLKPSPYLRAGQKMIKGDILNRDSVNNATKGCDYIYNFAGISSLDDTATNPLDTLEHNVKGNISILDAAIQVKPKRFVYASSIYVYSPKGGFYRCSKQSSEIYIEEYQRRFGLDFTILRYGTVYGPRADERNSIYKYLKQALEKGSIKCKGTGDEVREYINVKDAARLSTDILNEEYRNQHIVITGHHPNKFKDVVLMIREIMGKDIKITFAEEQDPDHYAYVPYSFIPKLGRKLVSNCYIDMGQGILECLHEISGIDNGHGK